jgi:heme A synthase
MQPLVQLSGTPCPQEHTMIAVLHIIFWLVVLIVVIGFLSRKDEEASFDNLPKVFFYGVILCFVLGLALIAPEVPEFVFGIFTFFAILLGLYKLIERCAP